MLRLALSLILVALPLGVAYGLWQRLGKVRRVPLRLVVSITVGGMAMALLAFFVESILLGWTELSLEAHRSGDLGSLLAMFLLVAPLEEGLKVLVVWPLYSSRRLTSPRLGLVFAVATAAGFAAMESLAILWVSPPETHPAARLLLGLPSHLFFAGLWGYALGSAGARRGRWFSLAWFLAMVLHGLLDHIVFGRGPGFFVLGGPVWLLMPVATWVALRDVAPGVPEQSISRRSALLARAEPPSLRTMRDALRKEDRPLAVHWVALGALVTLGVMIVLLAGAVYVGHRVGIDFKMADEADVRSAGPLVLLGSAVLLAFPVAGYLVARASAARTVLEPALGASLAIAAILFLLSLTAPIAVVLVLGIAPVAFVLACGGAWFGAQR